MRNGAVVEEIGGKRDLRRMGGWDVTCKGMHVISCGVVLDQGRLVAM